MQFHAEEHCRFFGQSNVGGFTYPRDVEEMECNLQEQKEMEGNSSDGFLEDSL